MAFEAKQPDYIIDDINLTFDSNEILAIIVQDRKHLGQMCLEL